ncbi:hypothetical protein [Qingshengfaniella alkalisoli]|uniref:Type I secretion protein n=1 Tax=Qingshengfaniella alkalisoli TaxID=2599296 RepID=A0A5B8IBH4_9RHOB|nr:hypothetical protein [Qingshengfaniella alkalisoli]QDY70786.1 hypothetical protein FPZ52_13815 [Qingshengfaniella alkalisoli]
MIVDRTTETISHFIGLFSLTIEKARLRDSYEEFTALKKQAELDSIESLAPAILSSHHLKPGKFDPTTLELTGHAAGNDEITVNEQTRDIAPPQSALNLEAENDTDLPIFADNSITITIRVIYLTPDNSGEGGLFGDDPSLTPQFPPYQPPAPPPFILELPFPGSAMTVTQQVAFLNDNDYLGSFDGTTLTLTTQALAPLIDTALALQPLTHALPAPGAIFDAGAAGIYAAAMADAHARFTALAEDDGQMETAVFRGDDAEALIVDGTVADNTPIWSDMLPAHHAGKADPPSDATVTDRMLPEGSARNPDFEDGFKLVTGGNYLANQATISTAWVDAPVIAVGGKWVQLDHIGQTAVATNMDTLSPGTHPPPTTVLQIAQISEESVPVTSRTIAGDGAPTSPKYVHIDHIAGDLLNAHYVRQVITVNDADQFEAHISAASGAYVLGDNTVFNVTGIVAAGMNYDLILVGGDFIEVNAVLQTLVLNDDDQVFGLPGSEAQDDPVTVADDPAADYPLIDAPETEPPVDDDNDPDTEPVPDAPEEPAPDNLLVNKAHIQKTGIDTKTEITNSMSEIVSNTDADMEALREELMQDPALAGIEYARVLKIDGDLIQSRIVEQVTTLNDSDIIKLTDKTPDAVEVVEGQNALINIAALKDNGIDSSVMADGDAYSDLLIHQAKLIDEIEHLPDADELANEAIAFLMDDDSAPAIDADDFTGSGKIQTASDSDDLMASSFT